MTVTNDVGHDPAVTTREHRMEVEETAWRRRVSGAPVWSGFAVALAVWVLLEFILAAWDLVPLGLTDGGNVDASELWWSGGASVIALFVGGVVAGASSRSHASSDGALQGVITWAIAVIGVLVLSAIGAGLGFGALGQSLGEAEARGTLQPGQEQQAQQQDFIFTQDEAQEAAGAGALFLGLTVLAAAAGGAAGAKMSGRERRRTVDVRAGAEPRTETTTTGTTVTH